MTQYVTKIKKSEIQPNNTRIVENEYVVSNYQLAAKR